MGNRAIVIFYEEGVRLDETKYVSTSPAIYLHWNGGPESVYAFLKEMNRREIREGDTSYEAARFVQLAGDWMDADERGTLSLGLFNGPVKVEVDDEGSLKVVPTLDEKVLMNGFDHGDNGWYLVNRSKRTVIHEYEQTFEEAFAIAHKGIAEDFLKIDAKLYGVTVEA